MRYLFARNSAAAPENLGFQKRSISRLVVMRYSKKMSTVGVWLSVFSPTHKRYYSPRT